MPYLSNEYSTTLLSMRALRSGSIHTESDAQMFLSVLATINDFYDVAHLRSRQFDEYD